MIDKVVKTGEGIIVTDHKGVKFLILKFPEVYKQKFSDVASLNAYSKSFDFLKFEPDDYSIEDLK
jgi:hypothetical protein